MKRFALAALTIWALTGAALAQSACPTFSYGIVLTAAQWQACFDEKQPALGYIPVNKAGDTMLGPLITAPSSSTVAGFNITPGSAPSSANNGDVWVTASGLYVFVNGAAIGPLISKALFEFPAICSGLSTTAVTTYCQVTGTVAASSTASLVTMIASRAETFANLYVANSTFPGTGNSHAFTLMVNGTATNITCTISGGSATTCNDTAHTAAIMAGQTMYVRDIATGTPNAATGQVTVSGTVP